MIPVVTPDEMRAIDAAAPEPVEVLIERAGVAVAVAALRMLGGGYGRRVLVVAGKGNNGNDGRVAARRLAARGVRVAVVAPGAALPAGPPPDLVVDAAFGTGFRGTWTPPAVPAEVPVLAVDIPSGVDGLTGGAEPDGVLPATVTVTFAALKPGLLLPPGRFLAGEVVVVPIGLDTGRARAWQVEPSDVTAWVPARPADSHKWRNACWVVAGSPGMPGASHLAARAALRAGAGYVRLGSPGLATSPGAPTEAVYQPLPATEWADVVAAGAGRFGALVLGPGLGRSDDVDDGVRRALAGVATPVVLDGDGLSALGTDAARVLRRRPAATVLTPHDGEFARLSGAAPGPDRFAAARDLAAATGAVVLLKGPATVVAAPDGRVAVSLAGDERLATAGSGDVLAGVVGALLARGVEPWRAAAAAAELHGLAGRLGPRHGLVAGDLPERLPLVWDALPPAPTGRGGSHRDGGTTP